MRVFTLAFVIALSSCGPGLEDAFVAERTDGLTAVTGFGTNPGALSLFIHEPANLGAGAPLVVALHGCTQGASAYEAAGWNALANQHRFLVAYPQTTANGGCFDWFSAAQQSRTGAQVTSILQMVQHLVTTKGIDSTRVYVTGLSAGGAMTNVLLAVAPDVFSRGAVMAGLPFGCATTQAQGFSCMSSPPNQTPTQWGTLVRNVAGSRPAPRVSLWHGTSDGTVSHANLQEQVDQWTDVNGIDVTADATSTMGVATRREFRNASGVTLVESWSVQGMNHGTPVDPSRGCGTAGAFMLDVGVCSSRYAAEFFGLVGASDAGVMVPDAGTTAPDAGSGTCLGEWFDTNVSHFSAGRAVLCAGRYCAVGSGDLLGDSLDQTWVRQVSSTRYEAGRCAGSTGGGAGGGGGAPAGGGGGATGGGGGAATGGGGAATGGGAGTGGGGAATGGGNATGGGSGGGNATGGGPTGGGQGGGFAFGGGGGGSGTPMGCGCTSVDPLGAAVLSVVLMARGVRRRRTAVATHAPSPWVTTTCGPDRTFL